MPAPSTKLTNDMDQTTRENCVDALSQWVSYNNLSYSKRAILNTLIQYAKTNLVQVNSGYFSLLSLNSVNVHRFDTFNNIIAMIDLPDLQFFQYALREVALIPQTNSSLRSQISQVAEREKAHLLAPHVQQLRGICIVAGICAYAYGRPEIAVLAAIGVFVAPFIIEARLDNALDLSLARIRQGETVALIGDGLDSLQTAAANMASQAVNQGLRRVNNLVTGNNNNPLERIVPMLNNVGGLFRQGQRMLANNNTADVTAPKPN